MPMMRGGINSLAAAANKGPVIPRPAEGRAGPAQLGFQYECFSWPSVVTQDVDISTYPRCSRTMTRWTQSSAATWAWTSPWCQVAAQVTEISKALEVAWPSSTYMTAGGVSDCGHPHGLQWLTGAMDFNTDPG